MYVPVEILSVLYVCLYVFSVDSVDMGGRCLMRAQTECMNKSTAIFIASHNGKYADVCALVEGYKGCIQNSVNSKLQCSLTAKERDLHSKNIYGYKEAPYNCHITGSEFAAQNFIITRRNKASTIHHHKCLLNMTLLILITVLLHCKIYHGV